jgi:hypothetical protein
MFGAIIYPPLNGIETIFFTLLMVLNCMVFGYTINLLGNILDQIGKKLRNFKIEANIINCYMNGKKIDTNL